jgi:rod shape-determining protein MreC
MAKSKRKIFEKWNSGLIIAALLIVILAAGFQTLRQAWFRISSNFFYPYLELPARGKYAAADGSSRLYSKSELAAKITRLEAANRIFASKVARFGELTVENEKLRALLKLPKRADCNYLAAEIIIRDPLLWKEGFTVNRGTADGVITGTPVLCFNPQYPGQVILAGVVKEAAKYSARVMSVLDPRFRLSAYFEIAETHGIINGDSRQTLIPDEINISFLSKQSKFTPGEKCFTSGFEHQIPGGFLIGSLKQLDSKDQVFSTQLYFSGKIIPAAPLDSLNFVVLAVSKDRSLPQ